MKILLENYFQKCTELVRQGWHMSPSRISHFVKQKLTTPVDAEWHEIKGGILSGTQILLRPAASQEFREIIAGTYDSYLYDTLLDTADLTGKVVWDVGAHIGYHTLGFAQLVGPSGQVVAFEPNPFNAKRLRENISANIELASRIKVEEVALGDSNERHIFRMYPDVDDARSTGGHLSDIATARHASAYSAFVEVDVQVL